MPDDMSPEVARATILACFRHVRIHDVSDRDRIQHAAADAFVVIARASGDPLGPTLDEVRLELEHELYDEGWRYEVARPFLEAAHNLARDMLVSNPRARAL